MIGDKLRCPHCGKRRGHYRGCIHRRRHGHKPSLKLPNGKPITVEVCRDYFERFGGDVLTETQYALFLYLLERAEKE